MTTAATPNEGTRHALILRPAPHPLMNNDDADAHVVSLPQPRVRAAKPSLEGAPKATVKNLDADVAEQAMAKAMACRIAQASLEALNGARPVQQLARWMDAMCLNALTTRARLHAQAHREQLRRLGGGPQANNVRTLHHRPVVHSVHSSKIVPGVYEIALVIADQTRFRAVAMRVELQGGLWKVMALRIG